MKHSILKEGRAEVDKIVQGAGKPKNGEEIQDIINKVADANDGFMFNDRMARNYAASKIAEMLGLPAVFFYPGAGFLKSTVAGASAKRDGNKPYLYKTNEEGRSWREAGISAKMAVLAQANIGMLPDKVQNYLLDKNSGKDNYWEQAALKNKQVNDVEAQSAAAADADTKEKPDQGKAAADADYGDSKKRKPKFKDMDNAARRKAAEDTLKEINKLLRLAESSDVALTSMLGSILNEAWSSDNITKAEELLADLQELETYDMGNFFNRSIKLAIKRTGDAIKAYYQKNPKDEKPKGADSDVAKDADKEKPEVSEPGALTPISTVPEYVDAVLGYLDAKMKKKLAANPDNEKYKTLSEKFEKLSTKFIDCARTIKNGEQAEKKECADYILKQITPSQEKVKKKIAYDIQPLIDNLKEISKGDADELTIKDVVGDETAPKKKETPTSSGALAAFAKSGKGGLANDPDEVEAIKELQQFLNSSYEAENTPVDGKYDSIDRGAIINFQEVMGIATDGDVGPETIKAIEKAKTIPGLMRFATDLKSAASMARIMGRSTQESVDWFRSTINFLTEALTQDEKNFLEKYEALKAKLEDAEYMSAMPKFITDIASDITAAHKKLQDAGKTLDKPVKGADSGTGKKADSDNIDSDKSDTIDPPAPEFDPYEVAKRIKYAQGNPNTGFGEDEAKLQEYFAKIETKEQLKAVAREYTKRPNNKKIVNAVREVQGQLKLADFALMLDYTLQEDQMARIVIPVFVKLGVQLPTVTGEAPSWVSTVFQPGMAKGATSDIGKSMGATVKPRPATQSGRNKLQDKWDQRYGATHNPDGTPKAQ